MNKSTILKVGGVVLSGIVTCGGFILDIINEKKTEKMIDEKIDKKFNERLSK